MSTRVDRKFNGTRYDAERLMGQFSESLRQRVDGGDLIEGWVDAVEETMQQSSVASVGQVMKRVLRFLALGVTGSLVVFSFIPLQIRRHRGVGPFQLGVAQPRRPG